MENSMQEDTENSRFERLVGEMYPAGRLIRSWTLTGGVSAQVTALEIALPGNLVKKVVVRRYGEADLAGDSQIAAHEFALLQTVQAAGVPVPTPLFYDQTGRIFPKPFIVIEFVEGQTILEPAAADREDFFGQLAAGLAGIHRVKLGAQDLAFLPDTALEIATKLARKPVQLDDSLQEGAIRAALEKVWPLPPTNPPGLLHGDYWPGNILWRPSRGGRLAVVLDWEDARRGDPLADLANTRQEILFAYGLEAMRIFTERYREIMPLDYTSLPYWELGAALRPAGRIALWAGDAAREKVMRERHAVFVAQAMEFVKVNTARE
jgi:aminoglycoside phosphotransferase (APT) family kinase protein